MTHPTLKATEVWEGLETLSPAASSVRKPDQEEAETAQMARLIFLFAGGLRCRKRLYDPRQVAHVRPVLFQ
jgi:hypothetical protein